MEQGPRQDHDRIVEDPFQERQTVLGHSEKMFSRKHHTFPLLLAGSLLGGIPEDSRWCHCWEQ